MTGATSADDARRAADDALADLERQRRRWGPVHRLVAAMAALGAENHFTDKIIQAVRGEPE